ncbi:MAG: hypothetical protein QM726_24220 [Chitinophagaceae bacterium]
MKKLIFLSLFLPVAFASKAQFTIVNNSTISLLELRQGEEWPISLQRVTKESDTCYVLQFRDQQSSNSEIVSVLKFPNLGQLRYFQQGLQALKKGATGDVAKFKDYTIKRIDMNKGSIGYLLSLGMGSVTNFKQPEADKIIAAIATL